MTTELEKWREGHDLNFACYHFSDPYQADKFRSASSLSAQDAIKSLMYAELFSALANGTLEAWGFRTDRQPEEAPQLIPTHFFDELPNFSDCENNVIAVGQWRYERIKIRKSIGKAPVPMPEPAAVAVPESSSISAPETCVGDVPPASKRAGGRPDTYPLSKAVLTELYARPALAVLSAQKLHPQFAEKFEQMFPRADYQISPPGIRTLRDQIKLYREELAETGNNWFLPIDSVS